MTDLALVAVDALDRPHAGGHQCVDGQWYNDHTGTRTVCAYRRHAETARSRIRTLLDRVHDAAHDPEAVEAVADALTAGSLADLTAEAAEGWRHLARLAVEGLAAHLDPETHRG